MVGRPCANAFLPPPAAPDQCLFSRMSTNCTADLCTHIEPCVLGGTPDCAQCGCAASVGLHWVKSVKAAAPLKIDHLVRASMLVGRVALRFRRHPVAPSRWRVQSGQRAGQPALVQITGLDSEYALQGGRCVKARTSPGLRRSSRPRLFEACRSGKHVECAVEIATYRCSCPCHGKPTRTESTSRAASTFRRDS